MTRLFGIIQCIFLCLVLTSAVQAEPVSINRGIALGFTFQHRGNCYVILPHHIDSRSARLSLMTAAPSDIGDAQIFRTFGPDLDLQIAVITNGLRDRCRDQFSALSTNIQPILDKATQAQIVRVDAFGVERRDDMIITGSDFSTITTQTLSDNRAAEIYQGTSGAILRAGPTVLGMAIQSEGVKEAKFLRIDEIVARLSRLLDARHGQFNTATAAPAEPSAAQCPAGSIPVQAISCNIEPVSPELACSNLLQGAPTRFALGSVAPRLIVSLPGGQPVPLRMVALASAAEAPEASMPQTVLIEITSSTTAPRWRRYASGDMSPTGTLRIDNGAAPYAAQIAITLQSSWNPELPIQLDCISLQ